MVYRPDLKHLPQMALGLALLESLLYLCMEKGRTELTELTEQLAKVVVVAVGRVQMHSPFYSGRLDRLERMAGGQVVAVRAKMA